MRSSFPFFSFACFSGQGSTSSGSTSIAQRARHPDELKKEDGKWMIDIEYYLSQQVFLFLPILSFLMAFVTNDHNLLLRSF